MWVQQFLPPEPRESSCSLRSRRRDLIELAGIYALLLIVIWTPRPWQWSLWAIAVACIATLSVVSFNGLAPMGFRSANLVRSLWAVGVSVGVALIAVTVADRLHTLRMPATPVLFFRQYGVYAVWACIQQVILQSFFLSRLLRLLPNAIAASGLAAGMFAIAHLPNPILTVATLIFGLASCLLFLRYRNLWTLAMSHAILGIGIAVTIPVQVDHNMLVGIGYLTYVDDDVLSRAITQTRLHLPKPQ